MTVAPFALCISVLPFVLCAVSHRLSGSADFIGLVHHGSDSLKTGLVQLRPRLCSVRLLTLCTLSLAQWVLQMAMDCSSK